MAKPLKERAKKSSPTKVKGEAKAVKRPSKYDEKIVVDATFEELMKELITPKKK